MPARVQRTRTAGQPGMPPGAKYVGRGQGDYGKWGNPFTAADAMEWQGYETVADARAYVTELFAQWLADDLPGGAGPAGTSWSSERRNWILDHIGELAGLDLACWCPLPEPGQPDHCHAAVLLELANGGAA